MSVQIAEATMLAGRGNAKHILKKITINNQHDQWSSIVKCNLARNEMRVRTDNNMKYTSTRQTFSTNDMSEPQKLKQMQVNEENQIAYKSITDILTKLSLRMEVIENERNQERKSEQEKNERKLLDIIEKQSKQIAELTEVIKQLKTEQLPRQEINQITHQNLNPQVQHAITQQQQNLNNQIQLQYNHQQMNNQIAQHQSIPEQTNYTELTNVDHNMILNSDIDRYNSTK